MPVTFSQLIERISKTLDSDEHSDPHAAGYSKVFAEALASYRQELVATGTPSEVSVKALLGFADSFGSVAQRCNCEYLLGRHAYDQHLEQRQRKRKVSWRHREDEQARIAKSNEFIEKAIAHFTKALNHAMELRDSRAIVALHVWLAKCYSLLSRHDRAYDHYAAAERLLDVIPADALFAGARIDMRFTLHLRMASHNWEWGELARGRRHMDLAAETLEEIQRDPHLNSDSLIADYVRAEAFQYHWVRALFEHSAGRLIQAYQESLKAQKALSSDSNLTNKGRCLRLIAEYAMNLISAQCELDPIDHVTVRQAIMQNLSSSDTSAIRGEFGQLDINVLLASVHELLDHAIEYARLDTDNTGRALVELAQRRAAWLTSLFQRTPYSGKQTRDIAERILHQAKYNSDPNVVGRAHIALGDAWLTEKPSALALAYHEYVQAFEVFDTHHLGGQQHWLKLKMEAFRQKWPTF